MERDKRKKSKMPCLFGGHGENLNLKTVKPRSQNDRVNEHNLFPSEVCQTSSKQGYYGTPIKTLLAKEMLNETSSKKRSPSLIAKLMGLDGLPSPQPIHKPQRKLPDNSHKTKRTADKKTTTEQQQFKDVYIDPEASHGGNQHYSSPSTTKRRSTTTKQELGYIQERCDQMLRESIAIKSKLERVDSNSDLMLTFLQKPDSLFVKHLHDQQTESLCNQITVLKPSNSRQYISHQRNNSRRFERKDDIVISPTRIVVLKPNLAKIYNDKSSFHSPDVGPGPLSEVRSSRYKSREAREIARQITSQMKEGFECGNVNLFHNSNFRGYAGDESESETTVVASRSSRRSSESSVIREAKKRMSQRWKTHGYKDVGIIGKGNTLEEMLSVPKNDHEYLRNTSRSRSVPPSFRNQNYESHAEEKTVVYNEPVHRGKNKGVKGNFNHREDIRSKNLRYDRKYRSSQQCSPEFDNILRERPSIQKIKNKDAGEQESRISNIHDGFRISSESSNELVTCMLGDEDSLNSQEPSTGGSVSLQLSGPEPESSENSKEVDQCAQISVLEASPTTEDVSSHSSGSDCFEKVSSQLHELRKQLQYLKMESGSTTSDNEEVDQQQQQQPSFTDPENWESTYLTDFLQASGFYDFYDHDLYSFMTVDRPVWLFDHLEKKYSEGSIVSRSERRLFYDRINEALCVVYESSRVLWCWWVRFEDELKKVVGKQEKEASEEFEEMCVDKDGEWVVAVKEVDVVGKEIAEMLVDELVLEFVQGGRL